MNSETPVIRRRHAILAAGCALLAGCNSSNRITGDVSFDGQPVQTGAIVFRPIDGGAASHGALITAGRYMVECGPGRHRVEIRGTRVMPESELSTSMPRMAGVPFQRDYIPAAYNTDSTLEVEVTAGGAKVFDFDLKSP